MTNVVVLGSSNTDLIVRARVLPRPGETVLGGDLIRAPGGKGANQAVAAARAGARVAFVAAFGEDDFGRIAREYLAREGVYLDAAAVVPGPTGVALIVVDEAGQNLIAVAPGANLRLTPDWIAALPDRLFAEAGAFVAQLETPPETVLAALARAKAAGCTTILNPAPANPIAAEREWLRHIDVLVLNEPEARMLAAGKSPSTTVDSARHAPDSDDESIGRGDLERWFDAGVSSVVITLGHRGYRLIDRPRRTGCDVSHPAVPVTAVDTVGAGDTFVGVLAAALAEDQPIEAAAALANRAAAITVTRIGAQAPFRNQYDGTRV